MSNFKILGKNLRVHTANSKDVIKMFNTVLLNDNFSHSVVRVAYLKHLDIRRLKYAAGT